MLVRLSRGPFLNVFFFFLKNVSLLILYFSTNNSIIITKREICNFHLLPQFHCNKHSNFLEKPSQKSVILGRNYHKKGPAKSWGDCILKWWAHVMSLGKYPAFSQVIRGALF